MVASVSVPIMRGWKVADEAFQSRRLLDYQLALIVASNGDSQRVGHIRCPPRPVVVTAEAY
jgi:hypothetical protein